MSGKWVMQWLITALVVVAVSEFGKRSTMVGAFVASLPLTSILAMFWIYRETGDRERIATRSYEILFFVLPSLLFFLILPWLLKTGKSFYPALLSASAVSGLVYVGVAWILKHFRY